MNMNKIIIGVVVAVVVIGGGVWYFLSQKGTGPISNSSTLSTESFSEKSSLKNLVARGGSWKCTFAIDAGGTNSTGTVYVAMGKVRSDFKSVVPQVNMTIESHMISDGAYAYTWTSSMPQGFKVPIDVTTDTAVPSGSENLDYNSALDYNCTAWPTDENMFVLPTDITFTAIK